MAKAGPMTTTRPWLLLFFTLILCAGCSANRMHTHGTPPKPCKAANCPPAQQEAATDLLELYENAVDAFSRPRIDGTGMKLPGQFPQSQAWTPAGSPCAHPDQRFPGQVSQWETDTWSDLYFEKPDPHFAAYKVETRGTPPNTSTTLHARFDSDCDGRWETLALTIQSPDSVNPTILDSLRAMIPPPSKRKQYEALGLSSKTADRMVAIDEKNEKTGKSPKMEAIDELFNLHKGAALYLVTPRLDAKTGRTIPCRFPKTQDWTPKGSPCAHPGKKFPANTTQWKTDTWSELGFQMGEPHHAAYRVESSGTLANAQIKLMARTDADCDGHFEVFTKLLRAAVSANRYECTPRTPFEAILESH